jgi:hypothetical protein
MALGKMLKKFWETISTGWVLEYPDSNEGPKDFFERERIQTESPPQQVERESLPSYRNSAEEDARADAVFKWSEQMRAAGR